MKQRKNKSYLRKQINHNINIWCDINFTPALHSWRFCSKTLLVLSEEETDPSAVHCGSDQLLCCLIVGIHASEISISLSLLMLLGWSLMWIASLTPWEYPWGSWSIKLSLSHWAGNPRSYWHVQKRPKFEFVKAVYLYHAP